MEPYGLGGLKKGRILRIRTGPTGFDIVHPDIIKGFHHPQFIMQREGDPYRLGAVPQGRIVHLYLIAHIYLPIFAAMTSWSAICLQRLPADALFLAVG